MVAGVLQSSGASISVTDITLDLAERTVGENVSQPTVPRVSVVGGVGARGVRGVGGVGFGYNHARFKKKHSTSSWCG